MSFGREKLPGSPDAVRLQPRLNKGFKSWSHDHEERFEHMGTLPAIPSIIRSQRIDNPKKGITRAAIYLPETAYLRLLRSGYEKAVGSRALANTIIGCFQATPAFANGEDIRSFTEYAIDFLDESNPRQEAGSMALGVASAHIDRLSDISDFTAGLSLSVAEEKGRRYVDRFGFIINKNTTRETYRGIPLSLFTSLGLIAYHGIPPGESATKHGIDQEVIKYVNRLLSGAMLRDKKEKGRMVWGIVPAGKGMTSVRNEVTNEPELEMGDTSYTSSLWLRCEGGVIPANRYDNEIIIGSIIPTGRPEDIKKNDFDNILADRVARELAMQAFQLTGLAIKFSRLADQEWEKIAA
jgi:hypothetical protein